MGVFYADSSVLVKRHVMEQGTHWFRNIVAHEHDNLVISSQLSEVEVCSAFARRRREAGLPKEALQQMMAAFERVCIAEYRIVPMSDAVVQQSKRLLAVYSLRAHDSIQLASAILVNNQFKHRGDVDFTFLAADERLLSSANAENLRTINPTSAAGAGQRI